jgi:hypothetical protein
MLPQFLQNQLYNLFLITCVVVTGFFSQSSYGQQKIETLHSGLISPLEKLIISHRKNFLKEMESEKPILLEKIKEFKLHPSFLSSIIFYSDKQYFELLQNECDLYSLIKNNLLKYAQGDIDNIYLSYIATDGAKESGIIPRKIFFDFLYSKKCISNKERDTVFAKNNFSSILKTIKFEIPKDLKSCHSIFNQWKQNPYTPYLCQIPATLSREKEIKKFIESESIQNPSKIRPLIQRSLFYKKKTTLFQQKYLKNLCSNLININKLCLSHLKKKYMGQDLEWRTSYV